MAGFDFGFDFQYHEAELVEVLSRAVRRRAVHARVKVSLRRENPTRIVVTVDGSLLDIEPLVFQLMRDLPLVAEGFRGPPGRLRSRRRLVQRLLTGFAESLDEFLEMQRDVSIYVGGVPIALTVDVGGRAHLAGRMRLMRSATSMYLAGQLDPETMLEEAHTAVETMMREYVGNRDGRGTFAQLVVQVHASGVIDDYLRDQMLRMKDRRRDVKHKGRGVKLSTVDDLIYPVLSVCQRIAVQMRLDDDRHGSPGDPRQTPDTR